MAFGAQTVRCAPGLAPDAEGLRCSPGRGRAPPCVHLRAERLGGYAESSRSNVTDPLASHLPQEGAAVREKGMQDQREQHDQEGSEVADDARPVVRHRRQHFPARTRVVKARYDDEEHAALTAAAARAGLTAAGNRRGGRRRPHLVRRGQARPRPHLLSAAGALAPGGLSRMAATEGGRTDVWARLQP